MTTIEKSAALDINDGPCPDWCDRLPADHPAPGGPDSIFHVRYFGDTEVSVDSRLGPMMLVPDVTEITDPTEAEILAAELVAAATFMRKISAEVSA